MLLGVQMASYQTVWAPSRPSTTVAMHTAALRMMAGGGRTASPHLSLHQSAIAMTTSTTQATRPFLHF